MATPDQFISGLNLQIPDYQWLRTTQMQIIVYLHIPRKRSHNFFQIKSTHLTRQVSIIDFFFNESLTEENRFGPQLQREQSYSV